MCGQCEIVYCTLSWDSTARARQFSASFLEIAVFWQTAKKTPGSDDSLRRLFKPRKSSRCLQPWVLSFLGGRSSLASWYTDGRDFRSAAKTTACAHPAYDPQVARKKSPGKELRKICTHAAQTNVTTDVRIGVVLGLPWILKFGIFLYSKQTSLAASFWGIFLLSFFCDDWNLQAYLFFMV